MSPSLSRYLKDFGAEPMPVAPPPPVMQDLPFIEEPIFADIPETPVVDLEAERREAYAEGHEAATRVLEDKHRAETEAAAAAHRAELEAVHAKYAGEIAERVAANIRAIAAALGQAVGAETAKALAPVLTETLATQAISDLATLITAAILDGAVAPITVSGPRNLFDDLSNRLHEHADLLRHVEAQDIDLTVTTGEGVLVTRMSAWADSLRKVLE
jgi:hypothetical protein